MFDRFEVQVGGVTVIFTQVTAAVLFNFIRHLPCHLHFTLTIRDLTVHVTRREFDSGTSQICSTHTCDLRMGNQKGSW